jgi:hypothetical protein
MALTVVLDVAVRKHVAPTLDVHPLHFSKISRPCVAGAVSVTFVPAAYDSVKLLLPDVTPFASAGLTVTGTFVVGSVEFTVIVYGAAGTGVPGPPCPGGTSYVPHPTAIVQTPKSAAPEASFQLRTGEFTGVVFIGNG